MTPWRLTKPSGPFRNDAFAEGDVKLTQEFVNEGCPADPTKRHSLYAWKSTSSCTVSFRDTVICSEMSWANVRSGNFANCCWMNFVSHPMSNPAGGGTRRGLRA